LVGPGEGRKAPRHGREPPRANGLRLSRRAPFLGLDRLPALEDLRGRVRSRVTEDVRMAAYELFARRPADVVDRERLLLLGDPRRQEDRKSTRLNSSHVKISYAVF